MNKKNIEAELRRLLKQFNIDSDNLNIKTKISDIDIDSLDLMHIIIDIEKKFDIFFEENEIRNISTIHSFLNLIESKINEK